MLAKGHYHAFSSKRDVIRLQPFSAPIAQIGRIGKPIDISNRYCQVHYHSWEHTSPALPVVHLALLVRLSFPRQATPRQATLRHGTRHTKADHTETGHTEAGTHHSLPSSTMGFPISIRKNSLLNNSLLNNESRQARTPFVPAINDDFPNYHSENYLLCSNPRQAGRQARTIRSRHR